MSTFELKAFGYYADFVVYPLVIAGLAVAPAVSSQYVNPLHWIAAFLSGIFVWTLVEYLVHRFVLHHLVYFRDLHGLHHQSPTALIGTPVWMSFALLLVGVVLPSWWFFGFDIGSGFSAGMITGYLAYTFAHHILHHWKMTPGTYLYRLKHKHALHHFRHEDGNFGVTSLFWDYVFGTAVRSARQRGRE
ncbi:sterol desaturase family protein [Kaistia algarum]|uniref:sterol desaturase family protein n=1 Tax=Kaistia algarum TaxID=2083279 RepID=UPI001402208A|nr:sterol desaturase family protein [Kaistia algarum]MCX5516011.1 sterol desaturase family protein [Kaistia algarum]